MLDDNGVFPDDFLTSAEEISRLLSGTPAPPKKPNSESGKNECGCSTAPPLNPANPIRSSAASARQRCRCGHCAYCIDNARWERIFEEKFADPGYYDRLDIRYNSTLAEPR